MMRRVFSCVVASVSTSVERWSRQPTLAECVAGAILANQHGRLIRVAPCEPIRAPALSA